MVAISQSLWEQHKSDQRIYVPFNKSILRGSKRVNSLLDN